MWSILPVSRISLAVLLGTAAACQPAPPANNDPRTPTGVAPSYNDAARATESLEANRKYNVLTQHNDNARTGAALHEDVLTPARLTEGRFGYIGSVPVEGKIYAQPLYVEQAAVICTGSPTVANANISYVATLENIVYAIDVDRLRVCWKTPRLGTPQPAGGHLGFDEGREGGVRFGIVSTPVIDLARNVMFAVARVWNETSSQVQFFVNTLDTRTGALVARIEVAADAATPGCGGDAFIPRFHSNRAGLLLVDNRLFLAFGSTIGEHSPEFHGFVIGFDVTNPAQPTRMSRVFCTTPTTFGAGIWMSGGGLASDGESIYFSTGTGGYPLKGPAIDNPQLNVPDRPRQNEYPSSFVKLAVADLSVRGAFTDTRTASAIGLPYHFGTPPRTIFWARERSDADLGSGGVLLVGNRLIGGGKDGRLDIMSTTDMKPIQSFLAFFNPDNDGGTSTNYHHTYHYDIDYHMGANLHGGPVAWDVRARPGAPFVFIYGWAEKDVLKRFTFVPATGQLTGADAANASPQNPTPTVRGAVRAPFRSMPGGILSLSANGASSGIVWGVVPEPYTNARAFERGCRDSADGKLAECDGCYLTNGEFSEYCDATRGYVPGRLYAFAADEDGAGSLPILWGDKRSAAPNNLIPRYAKFTAPTIAHGKVILATGNDEARFYGVRDCTPPFCSPATMRRPDDVMRIWNDFGSASFTLFGSTRASFELPTAWRGRDGGWGDSIRWLPGDYDGDGLTDVAAVWNDAGWVTMTVRLRKWQPHRAAEHWAIRKWGWEDSTRWLSGDFDGDGRSDVAAIWRDGTETTFSVYRSAGTSFEQRYVWANRDGGWGDAIKWVAGDFNGDTRDDIAAIWPDQGANVLTVRRSTGSSFIQRHWIVRVGGWMDSTKWVAGDFSGDGRADLVGIWNNNGITEYAVYRSAGTHFHAHAQWRIPSDPGGWGDSIRWLSGDFNVDGRSDLVAIWPEGGQNILTVRRSTGSTFVPEHWRVNGSEWMDTAAWIAGRFR